MKTGDLVKVSKRGFTGIGYITRVCDSGYYVVHYFSQHGKGTDKACTSGLWSLPYITLLREVKHEEDTCKT